MEARPPALIEAIVAWLLPPACREYVLGDLCERYTSLAAYVVEAIRTIPLVIAGRVSRTYDALLVLGEAQILLLTFAGSASDTRRAISASFLISAGVALAALIVRDAYTDLPAGDRSSAAGIAGIAGINAAFEAALRAAVKDIAWVAGCMCLTTVAIEIAVPHLLPPPRVIANACASSALMLFAWRSAWWTQFAPGSRRMRTVPLSSLPGARRKFAAASGDSARRRELLVERQRVLRAMQRWIPWPMLIAAAGSAVRMGFTAHQWSAVQRGSITPLWTALMALMLGGIFRRGAARLQDEIDATDSRQL